MKKYDGMALSAVAGISGVLAKDVLNFTLKGLGVLKFSYWQLAASSFLMPKEVNTPGGWLIGAVSDFIVGGALGVIVLAVFRIFGSDLWWFKGAACGGLIWVIGPGLILRFFTAYDPFHLAFRIASFFDHLLFGLVTAFVVWQWSKPRTDQPHGEQHHVLS